MYHPLFVKQFYIKLIKQLKVEQIFTRHGKKLNILSQKQHHKKDYFHCNNYLIYSVCNMSSYYLYHYEYTALSFGLDHYIKNRS